MPFDACAIFRSILLQNWYVFLNLLSDFTVFILDKHLQDTLRVWEKDERIEWFVCLAFGGFSFGLVVRIISLWHMHVKSVKSKWQCVLCTRLNITPAIMQIWHQHSVWLQFVHHCPKRQCQTNGRRLFFCSLLWTIDKYALRLWASLETITLKGRF